MTSPMSKKLEDATVFVPAQPSALWQDIVRHGVLRGIAYNSSNKGKCANTNDIETTESTENCETEKKNTEVENDKKYLSYLSTM